MNSAELFDPSNELLAFCHIEKAAGTSLIHVLRRNFLFRFAAVRPLTICADSRFSSEHLRTYLHLNPLLRCISGHAVVPYNQLRAGDKTIRYITQFREPIARVESQFKFWRHRMNKSISIDEFVAHPTARNFQVNKIAGEENLEKAKELIQSNFLLAGPTDQFDQFLVLLGARLNLDRRLLAYETRNVSRRPSRQRITRELREILLDNNELDISLYNWIVNDYFPQKIAEYGPSFSDNVAAVRQMSSQSLSMSARNGLEFVHRNGYIKPVTGLIREMNGLPYNGSYAYTRAQKRKFKY